MDRDLVHAVLARRGRAQKNQTYILHPNKEGILVLSRDYGSWTIVTYIRLSQRQLDILIGEVP